MNMTSNPSVHADQIVVGQRVHCILYGGKDGLVVAIHGEQAPDKVRTLDGVGVAGGSAHFDIIWSDGSESPNMPEALVRASVQWRVYPEVANADEVAQAHTNKALYKAKVSAQIEEERRAYAQAREAALANYPKLNKLQPGERAGGQFAAKNIRLELKTAWPKAKFSVRSDYNSVSIHWTDGPTKGQVEAIVFKYRDGHFDGMQDMTVSTPSAFTDIFGGVTYLSYSRELSEALVAKAVDVLWERLPGNLVNVERPTADAVCKHSYSKPIPSLEPLTVGEAARVIASNWDDACKQFSKQDRYSPHDWLVWDYGNPEPNCKALS